jgi:hypothetical protein
MVWPPFDLAEVINQTVAAIVTVASVFVGGRLAFSYGVRQLRHERAIDRRIESQEALLAAMDGYRSELQMVRTVVESTADDLSAHAEILMYVQKQAVEKGREFGRALSRAEMYSTEEERAERRPLAIARFAADIVAWKHESSDPSPEPPVDTLTSAISTLEKQQELLVQRIRGELVLFTSARSVKPPAAA